MNLKLSATNQGKFLNNVLVFIAPVLTIYLVSIVGIIQAHNGAIVIADFVPTSFTWGAMTLYVLNVVLDFLKKLEVQK